MSLEKCVQVAGESSATRWLNRCQLLVNRHCSLLRPVFHVSRLAPNINYQPCSHGDRSAGSMNQKVLP